MKRLIAFTLVVFFWSLASVRNLAAQDLVITNARIIVGNGDVINQGSILIRSGRIASVSAGPQTSPASRRLMRAA
jgi:imidazolonepropionase-like amidohydrolase